MQSLVNVSKNLDMSMLGVGGVIFNKYSYTLMQDFKKNAFILPIF